MSYILNPTSSGFFHRMPLEIQTDADVKKDYLFHP